MGEIIGVGTGAVNKPIVLRQSPPCRARSDVWVETAVWPAREELFFCVFFAKMHREKYTCGVARPLRVGLDFANVAISGFVRWCVYNPAAQIVVADLSAALHLRQSPPCRAKWGFCSIT
jgi:hypothetical protein